MRYGRRIPSTNYDVTQTIKNSCSFTTLPKYRICRSFSAVEQYEDLNLSNDNNKLSTRR